MTTNGKLTLGNGFATTGSVERKFGRWTTVTLTGDYVAVSVAEDSPIHGLEPTFIHAAPTIRNATEIGEIFAGFLDSLDAVVKKRETLPRLPSSALLGPARPTDEDAAPGGAAIDIRSATNGRRG